MAEIEAGDVVVLKSGGPEMTVVKVGDEKNPDKVSCAWFYDHCPDPRWEAFPAAALRRVGP